MGYMTSATSGVILTGGNTVYNEASADKDFRIESNGQTHMLFVDAGNDRVAIGTDSPAAALHIVAAGSGDHLILEGTLGSAATSAPNFVLFRNGADAAADIDDADLIGQIVFRGENDNSTPQEVNYATIEGGMDDTTDGSEDGHLTFNLIEAGALTEFIRIRAATRDVVINDQQDDIDFRIESDSADNLFFTDASTHRVGVGLADPLALLEVAGAAKLRQGAVTSQGSATTLTAVTHAGNYIIATGDNHTINLPSTSTIGEQYCFIATHSNGCTIGRNGNNLNGATDNITVDQYKAKTAIAIGSNNWVIIG